MPNNSITPGDQPPSTTNNEASLPSLSSSSFQDTLGKLQEIFNKQTDSRAESAPDALFDSLATETASAAAQSAASIRTVASTTSTGFLVKLSGQVVTAKRPDATVPQAESFGFSLKPVRSPSSLSAATTSAWSDSYKQAIGIRLSGGKGRDTSESDDDYDLPLSKCYCRRLEGEFALSLPAEMENDSVEECLQGNSVFDPLASEQNTGSEPADTVALIEPSEVTMSPF